MRNPSGNVKRSPAKRGLRRSAQPKLKTFRHLLAASSGVDNASEDSMIDKMTKDRAQRPADKAFQPAHKRRALTEHEKAQKAFQKNYERLRAERLAREAEKPKER
jgi:hypothetical protein